MARGRRLHRYTTDSGAHYSIHFLEARAGNANWGWAAWAGDPKPPKHFRPRYLLGVDSVGNYSRIVIANKSAAGWTNPAVTWSVAPSGGGALVTFTRVSAHGEEPPS